MIASHSARARSIPWQASDQVRIAHVPQRIFLDSSTRRPDPFGENLGVDYTFVGTDGVRISGGGEGGSTYRCRVDEQLGGAQAQAMDIDEQAVMATRANAAQNAVQDRLTVSASANDIDGHFDVVVANILAAPLIELADSIAGFVKTGCLLALSGILSEQVGDVLEAYRPWISFDEPLEREQGGQTWARLTGRRTGG